MSILVAKWEHSKVGMQHLHADSHGTRLQCRHGCEYAAFQARMLHGSCIVGTQQMHASDVAMLRPSRDAQQTWLRRDTRSLCHQCQLPQQSSYLCRQLRKADDADWGAAQVLERLQKGMAAAAAAGSVPISNAATVAPV